MGSEAINWYPVLEAVQTILEQSIIALGAEDVNWFVGGVDVESAFCPMGVVTGGDEDDEVIDLGKDPDTGRKFYREQKLILITLATHQEAPGSHPNTFAAAHDQLEEFLRKVKNAITADSTLDGTVIDSTLLRSRKAVGLSSDEEVLQIAEVTLEAWQNWY